jgi:electron transport complex protein RnfE
MMAAAPQAPYWVESRWTAGLWRNNPALVQMLGLCPLLAVTTSVVNGLLLGIATAMVMLVTSIAISLLRTVLIPAVRIPVCLLIVAALVTSVDLVTKALFFGLHQAVGLFIPLIVTNCAILTEAETVASRRPVGHSALSALATGAGFAAVLVVLGALRELVGSGTLFADLDQLFGPAAASLTVDLGHGGALIGILPPGAFFGLAILLAARNIVVARGRRE